MLTRNTCSNHSQLKDIMKSRLPLPNPAEFTEAQQQTYDSIIRTRGSIDGPFLAWLHSSELAGHAEKLGNFCRWHTLLSARESELIILTVAAHYACEVEWQLHEPVAREAGLDEEIIAAIRRREKLGLDDERLSLLRGIALQMLETHRIEQSLYEKAQHVLGNQTLVETIGVMGYYSFVAATCNAFEMTLG